MPTAAAVSETAERASCAHQTKEHARQGRLPPFRSVGCDANLGKTESERVTQHDREERHEAALGERPEQSRVTARFALPVAQHRRAQKQNHADAAAARSEP